MKKKDNLTSRNKQKTLTPPSQPTITWIEHIKQQVSPFKRFGGDMAGVLMLAAGIMLALGLIGQTTGLFVNSLVRVITLGLGWGSFLIVLLLICGGILVLGRNTNWTPKFTASQVLALEGFFFGVLALMTALGGRSVERVEAGKDGGVVGWGLIEILDRILPAPWSTFLLVLIMLMFVVWGFGLFGQIMQRLEGWLTNEAEKTTGNPQLKTIGITTPVTINQAAKIPATNRQARTRTTRQASPPIKGIRDDRLPPFDLLKPDSQIRPDEQQIHQTAAQIETALSEFGVPARVVGFRVGPTVTQFAVEPGFIDKSGPDGNTIRQKIKVSQISALQRDLTLRLRAEKLRIEAPVPGHSFVGIEVPNPQNTLVGLRSILESDPFIRLNAPLAMGLGRGVSGEPVVADLSRMPHLLVAGTTGSGKSVCIAALTACLVMNNSPEQLRLAMLDPKMVELVRFNGLPHLLGRVETEMERMVGVLRWAIMEMDQRYRILEEAHARDLDSYNQWAVRNNRASLPRVVILVDELADLMNTAPEQVEPSLVRLAQMARATGIHLVLATQRPSTDVVTGLIKANFPARISFTMASSIDSRVILDVNGAEDLLGRGDMLFLNPEIGSPVRVQGVWVDDREVERVIEFWQNSTKDEHQQPAPWEEILNADDEAGDSLLNEAIKIIRSSRRANTSMLQRRLRIGYPRAARLMEELEQMGVVGSSQGSGKDREVLVEPEDAEDATSTPDNSFDA
jgi:DNA segregation ATPase FtsK/SpoIIIE, S-DNA-T family